MMELVRWVHPYKVEDDGKLKPEAFPISQLQALGTKNSVSLTNMNLVKSSSDKSAVHQSACSYCRRWKDEQKWSEVTPDSCDCEIEKNGAKGACSTEINVINMCNGVPIVNNIGIKVCPTKTNPAHVVLSGSLQSSLPSDLLLLQDCLLLSFESISTVKSIIASVSIAP